MSDFVICATRSMRRYAEKVVDGMSKLPRFAGKREHFGGVGLLRADRFADGEMEVAVGASVRGRHVVVFASCARNEAGISLEEAKIELYHAVDALKRCQPGKITVFEPFVSCSRSDRALRRSSVGLWVHLKTLASLGAQHIITYQLHSDKSKSMVDPAICALDDIPAHTLLQQRICDAYIQDMAALGGEVRSNWAFCSVDAGGEKLARTFANAFQAHLVIAHKQRDASRPNAVESVNILSAEPVEGKTLWIVDDMVDTAGSVETLVRALAPLRPREVNIVAVHALFSPPAAERLRALAEEGLLRRVMVTDTVCPDALAGRVPGLEVVPSTWMSARIINSIVTNAPMGELLLKFDATAYLKSPALWHYAPAEAAAAKGWVGDWGMADEQRP